MISNLLDIFAANCCIECNKEGYVLCACCEIACIKPQFYSSPLLSEQVFLLAKYENQMRNLIHAMKISANRSVAEYFGKLLAHHYPNTSIDLVGYVSASSKMVRERGYDQARLIAKTFARLRGLKFEQLLIRTDNNLQKFKSASQRLKDPPMFIPTKNYSNQRILLIDDVITTGASLLSAKKSLAYKQVSFACVAATRFRLDHIDARANR